MRLVLFEDDDALRNSLCTLLESSPEFEVIGNYGDVLQVKQVIKQDKPDVVLLDIDMPKLDGISAIPIIKEINSGISVLMYTQFEDDEKLFDSLCAGADGYILKKTSPLKLFESISEVRTGGVPMSPSIAKKVLHSFRKKNRTKKEMYSLTSREMEVLNLLVKGYTVKYIAFELHIAYETCRSHHKNIYKKLQVQCGKEAIAKVMEERIRLNR
jgi:DNA-binding NarL/FixJ family response regulator